MSFACADHRVQRSVREVVADGAQHLFVEPGGALSSACAMAVAPLNACSLKSFRYCGRSVRERCGLLDRERLPLCTFRTLN